MEPTLNEDFRDMIGLLNDENVEYLLVGGWAVSFHARFRVTEDIDFWIRPSLDNAQRVMRALIRFGAPTQGLTAEDFAQPRFGLQIGNPPLRIDLLTRLKGIDFEQAWTGRVKEELDGIPIYVIGREALLQNKLEVGREKDLADAVAIRKAAERSGEP